MDNPNPDKAAKVDEIAQKLESAGTVLVTEYRGLDVPAQATLRQAVKDAGGEYKIYKNTLTKIAAERAGVDIDDHLTGPTALAFAYPAEEGGQADPVMLSKALSDFAKANEALVIKGGVMDGDAIDAAQVTALSKVPPREEMLAKFAGLLQAPMSKFAGLLQAMPQNMAGLIKALADKGGAGMADEAPAAEIVADDAPAEEAPAADDTAPEETDAADAEAPADAEAATDDAASDAASDQTDDAADAASDETDDKED